MKYYISLCVILVFAFYQFLIVKAADKPKPEENRRIEAICPNCGTKIERNRWRVLKYVETSDEPIELRLKLMLIKRLEVAKYGIEPTKQALKDNIITLKEYNEILSFMDDKQLYLENKQADERLMELVK